MWNQGCEEKLRHLVTSFESLYPAICALAFSSKEGFTEVEIRTLLSRQQVFIEHLRYAEDIGTGNSGQANFPALEKQMIW